MSFAPRVRTALLLYLSRRWRSFTIQGKRLELEPNYVALQEARDGEHPNGKYSWRDGVLTICMLTLTPGTVGDKLAFRFDYDTCAIMTKKVK